MIKNIFYLTSFIFLLFTMTAFGQLATIKGSVKDCNTHEKIENARIILKKGKSLPIQVYTNKEGEFLIENLSDGDYEIIPQKEFYKFDPFNLNSLSRIIILDGICYDGSLYDLRKIEQVNLCLENTQTLNKKSTIQICPICKKGDQVVPIIYGGPSEESIKKAKKGEVHLGECGVGKDEWYCKRDKYKF